MEQVVLQGQFEQGSLAISCVSFRVFGFLEASEVSKVHVIVADQFSFKLLDQS
jgi:hypothetical protein